MQHAVILTYPAHLLHSAVTVQSIRKHHPDITSYIVVLDDLSNLAWADYVPEAMDFYSTLGCATVTASRLPFLANITRPWVRQQTVKLYLDQILDLDSWFFCDGDCRLLASWPDHERSAHPMPWGETGQGFCHYVGSILGLPDWQGFRDIQGRYVTTSAPPTRIMDAQNLQSLREFVIQTHGKELWEIHAQRQRQVGFVPSEWELMDCFDINVQNKPVVLSNHRDRVEMSWSADKPLGRQYWIDHGIAVSDELWQKLPLARYL